jgi:hypothetical protein
VTHLLTFVDTDDAYDDGPDACKMSVSARHEAVLTEGPRVGLLDGRGWSETQSLFRPDEASEHDRRRYEHPSAWASVTVTVEEIKPTARDVVGPDDPFERRTQTDMEASHWEALAQILRREGERREAARLSPSSVSDRCIAAKCPATPASGTSRASDPRRPRNPIGSCSPNRLAPYCRGRHRL